MHPAARGFEVYLDPVHGVHLLSGVVLPDFREYAVYQRGVAELYPVLGYVVLRKAGPVLADFHALVSHVAEEQGDSDHGVPAVVARRIDYPSVAFASDERSDLVHLRGDVHLSHRCGVPGAAVGFGHIPESPAGAEVRYRVAGRDTLPLGSAEQVVGHGDEGILLDERLSVLADERETVHIGIYAYSEIRAVLDHRLAQGREVRGKRLRVMCELAAYLGVYGDAFHSEPFQQPRHYYGSDGIHGIQRSRTLRFPRDPESALLAVR